MKRRFIITMILCISMIMTACVKSQPLENMSSMENEDYMAITWNDKIYVPFCAVEKSFRGKQIGIVDNDKNNQVYEEIFKTIEQYCPHALVGYNKENEEKFKQFK